MKKRVRNLVLFLISMLLVSSCGNSSNKFGGTGYFQIDNTIVFPEVDSLILLNVNTSNVELPESKKDGEIDTIMEMKVGSSEFYSYGSIQVQGSSTAQWPKKNWSLNFFDTKERDNKLKIKIGDSVASDKWIAKAEWIDPTINRNALAYGLWTKFMDSRNEYPKREVDNSWYNINNMIDGIQLSGTGVPKYHPIQISVNGEFYGLSMLILGKDPENYNIDMNNPNHMLLEFDARGKETDKTTWEKFSEEGIGEWVEGNFPSEDDFTQEQREAIDKVGKVLSGDSKYFSENFDKHLDKTNMIDMMLFIEAIHDWDAVAQDLNIVTYDLEKWYFLPWDKDTSFGLWWDGEGLKDDLQGTLLFKYNTVTDYQQPWNLVYNNYTSEVEERYRILRDSNVLTIESVFELMNGVNKKIPKNTWKKEIEKWEDLDRPSVFETNPSQIVEWFKLKLEKMDEQFNY